MRPGGGSVKRPGKGRTHGRREHGPARPVKTPPRAWSARTMHHPATRIGEIQHGRS